MLTEQFLTLILPSQGKRVVVSIGPKGPRQYFFDNDAAAAAHIAKLDAAGTSAVYHGCATYGDLTNDKGRRLRKAHNVVSVKSFWADLDVDANDPNKYPTQVDAILSVNAFSQQLNLPNPYTVKSGSGVHAYWVLTDDITPDEWIATATLLKAVMVHAGLLAGPERTADIASVLRPVGSTHRKGTPTPVELHDVGVAAPRSYIHALLESYATLNSISVESDDIGLGPMPSHLAIAVDNDLAGSTDYGPAPDITPIVEGCAIIREFRDSGGNIEEPLWRACLGVVKLCEGGEQLSHDWSSGHKSYTYGETQTKLDNIQGGATTCATLHAYRPAACAACPHNGQIKSPITIAYRALAVQPPPPAPLNFVVPGIPNIAVPQLPQPYQTSLNSNGDTCIMEPERDKLGAVTSWRPILTILLYPIAKIKNRKGEHSLLMRAHPTPTTVRDFELPTGMIADTNTLFKFLGALEIAPEPGMRMHVQTYLNRWMDHHRQHTLATKAYERFGWHERDFLLGDMLFKSDGTAERVALTGSALNLLPDFAPKGDLQTWVDTIDRAYNHPGVEDLQFAILAGMAAPLVRMFNDYGGMVVYLHSGDSGKGKTTIERAALSVWSSWRHQQVTCGRATANAIYASLGAVSNMPFVIDEMTNLENHAVGQLVHDLSAGTPKKRCDVTGSLVVKEDRWETIILGSGNLLLGEKLAQHRVSGEAERVRIFEYTIDVKRSPIEPGEAMRLFPKLSDNYGHAGLQIARYLVDNYDAVHEELMVTQDKLTTRLNMEQRERYWAVLLACVATMHGIATRLGLVHFPAAPLIKWMAQTLAANRASLGRSVVQPDTLLSMMLSDLWQGMLITQGAGQLYKGWDAYVEQHPRGQITGRAIVPRPGPPGLQDREVIYIRADAAKAWCNRKGVTAQDVFRGAAAAGLLKAKETRFGVGSGSRQYSGVGSPEPCWELAVSSAQGIVAPVPNILPLARAGKP